MARTYKPALIIGLGGTGVLALQHVKAQLLSGSQSEDLPPNVRMIAFDTVQEQDARADNDATVRGVTLKPGEYWWIGGDVYDTATRVRKGEFPHIGSWFQSETYLKTLPRAAFTLQRGAGQLRQFGRLAVFTDVAAPAMSNIAKLLNSAMTDIRNTGYIANLDVYLVSSVAGGTGAGMFVDLAYLVRMLAREEQNGQKITLRGFLVLPEAFSAIPGGIDNSMRARAYAAMRENRRFMVDFSWRIGYPFYYQASGEGGVWRSRLQTKLFDSLYHVDGQRSKNPLTNILPKYGVTPTIGDAIVAMLDDPEDKYGQHNQNVITAAGRDKAAMGSTAFDSAVGTYTMILPMREIIDSLSYRLLLQSLGALTPAATGDEDGYPITLKPDGNLEAGDGRRGRDAAIDFMQATEIQSLHSDDKVMTTLLPQEIVRIAGRYSPQNPGLIEELASRAARDWETTLDPTGDTADVRAVRQQVQQELSSKLTTEVLPKMPGEKPQDAVARIGPAVERYKAEHLGREDPRTGQRSGGKYLAALEAYAVKHVDRFRDTLRLEVLNILNGSKQHKAREAKTGKLSYLQDMLDGLDQLLRRFLLALEETHALREKLGTRASLLGNTQSSRQEMERSPGGFLGWGGKQKAYLETEQALIDFIKADITEQVLRSVALQMQEHVHSLKGSADRWASTLAIGFNGLYGYALRGQRVLGDILKEQSVVKVRSILPDTLDRQQKYYDELFHKYADELQDGLDEVLKDINWGYEKRRSGGRDVFNLTLTVASAATAAGDADDVQSHNLNLFMNRCRQVFASAWDQEYVLKYLMTRFPRPEALAQELVDNGGPLLMISGGLPKPSNYFHIKHGQDKKETEYLDGVKVALVKRSGATGVVNEVINSSDPFACRLVHTLDLVPLESVDSYAKARTPYLTYAQRVESGEVRGVLGRETLHLFPAEVNAARFETRIPTELGLPARELHNEVVLQLENMSRLRIFVRAWLYGVVYRGRDDLSAGYVHYYALRLPAENLSKTLYGSQGELKVYLTQPIPEAPSLLGALETFQYTEKDVRDDIEQPIFYERMERAVELAKQAMVSARLGIEKAQVDGREVERVTKPFDLDPMIRTRLERLPQVDQTRAWRLLAERAIIKESEEEVRQDIVNTNNPTTKRDASMVFWLALEDEARSVQEAITSLLEASRGIG